FFSEMVPPNVLIERTSPAQDHASSLLTSSKSVSISGLRASGNRRESVSTPARSASQSSFNRSITVHPSVLMGPSIPLPTTLCCAARGGIDMARIKKVGHVVLGVRDTARSVKFYTEVLGMELVTVLDEMQMAFFSFGERDHDIAVIKVPDEQP